MAASNSAGKAATEHESATNIKETLESILVAFILAFIFRAFVVEAFVIPTGSMGPTLLGAHTHWRCPDCGYEWDANFSQPPQRGVSQDDVNIPSVASSYTYNVRCPNCGFRISPEQATAPPVYFGDRILVLKYQYIHQEPHRWDVVVFKAPVRGDEPGDYSENFIKRLVGLPNDTLMVLDGDVYVKHNGEAGYHIATKPRAAQDALWREVCDVDYQPRKLDRGSDPAWKQPWEQVSGSGWGTASRVFSFKNAGGAGSLKFDPDANPWTFALTDLIGYDQTKEQVPPNNYTGDDRRLTKLVRFNVSDVKLDFSYERQAGDGPLRLRLTKYDDAFTAIISANDIKLEKSSQKTGQSAVIGQAPLPDNGGKPRHIEYSNVDYKVCVRVDGQDLVATNDTNYAPNIPQLIQNYMKMRAVGVNDALSIYRDELNPRPTISISAENQSCSISHLRLFHDVYYTPYMDGGSSDGWTLHATPDDPDVLGKDDYFVMGDNSPMSYDARFWPDDVNLVRYENLYSKSGRVPRRFMIGRAFFVYWPAGFRPFGDDWPGFVPDFGDMRFIH